MSPPTTFMMWHKRIALLGIGLFIVIVVSLHILQSPANSLAVPVSEFVLGPWGWLMTIAFFSLAVGSWATYRAVRYTASIAGWGLGTIGLKAWIAGTAIAGLFPTDAHDAALSWHGVIHGAAASVALFSLIVVELAAVRRPVGRVPRGISAGIGGLAVAVFALSFIAGSFGVSESFGISERVVISLHCVWLILLTTTAQRMSSVPAGKL